MVDPKRTNSLAPRAKGRNVLRLNGPANFNATLVNAASGDSLWTIGDVHEYRGTIVHTRSDDAFLVPGFPTRNRR